MARGYHHWIFDVGDFGLPQKEHLWNIMAVTGFVTGVRTRLTVPKGGR